MIKQELGLFSSASNSLGPWDSGGKGDVILQVMPDTSHLDTATISMLKRARTTV